MTTETETARTAEPDLRGFLIAHAGFRTEFGRLADAAEAVRDPAHVELIENQIQLVRPTFPTSVCFRRGGQDRARTRK